MQPWGAVARVARGDVDQLRRGACAAPRLRRDARGGANCVAVELRGLPHSELVAVAVGVPRLSFGIFGVAAPTLIFGSGRSSSLSRERFLG